MKLCDMKYSIDIPFDSITEADVRAIADRFGEPVQVFQIVGGDICTMAFGVECESEQVANAVTDAVKAAQNAKRWHRDGERFWYTRRVLIYDGRYTFYEAYVVYRPLDISYYEATVWGAIVGRYDTLEAAQAAADRILQSEQRDITA